VPKKQGASIEGGGGGEEGGGMPGGGGDEVFVPLVMFSRSAVSVALAPLATRVPSISSERSRVLSFSGGGRRSPYELVRIWRARLREIARDGARWRVRRAISITHMQSAAISCHHFAIKRMPCHCIR
jgi:hypothetical protein